MLHIQKPQQDITVQLEQGKILPLVFRLTIPAVIAQLITFLYNIVDRMYVARIEYGIFHVAGAWNLDWHGYFSVF